MRILFFTWPSRLQRFLDVVAELDRRGHEVLVAAPRDRGGELPKPLQGLPRVRLETYDESSNLAVEQATRLLRLVRDYVWYLTAPVSAAPFNRTRALDFLLLELSGGVRGRDPSWPDPAFPLSPPELDRLRDALAELEQALPPDPGVVKFIRDRRPDVVLVTPLVLAGSHQAEVVKAARQIGVPSGFLVYSWDNLSNKGLIHVVPDRVYVWNELQRHEAAELHGIPSERVVPTGAPRWDSFFARHPSIGRGEFCEAHGFDPAKAIVLYVGSSSAVVPDETLIIERWLGALRGAPGQTREANVLVRPHPREDEMWAGWIPDRPRVSRSSRPRQADQSLYDELYHSAAVVGLNTSAQVEASILGKPVLTFPGGALAPGQAGSLHFYYLLRERGGAVLSADSLEEHVDQLARVIAGDYDREAIRRFCESFVRPRGLDRPASPILADEILELAHARQRVRPRPGGSVRARLERLVRSTG